MWWLIRKIIKYMPDQYSEQYLCKYPNRLGPIGVFDSGFGGLTVLKKLMEKLPQYDYIYLADNARAPYGERSLDTIYEFTRESIEKLFELNCPLVIIACNTASENALERMNKYDLIKWNPNRRIFGVIEPTVKKLDLITKTKHVGLLGTATTINSNFFVNKTKKMFPNIVITGQKCPLFVSLIENNEYDNNGTDYYVKKYIDNLLSKDDLIDTVILLCTHFPILLDKIKNYMPKNISIIEEGDIVTNNILEYIRSNPNFDNMLSKNRTIKYFTTGNIEKFSEISSFFLGKNITVKKISLESNYNYFNFKNVSTIIGFIFVIFVLFLFLCLLLRKRLLSNRMIRNENIDYRIIEN